MGQYRWHMPQENIEVLSLGQYTGREDTEVGRYGWGETWVCSIVQHGDFCTLKYGILGWWQATRHQKRMKGAK